MSGAKWEPVGGREGGAVFALAFSPYFANDGIVFAGTLGGVYRSRDGGMSWEPSGGGGNIPFVEAIAVSPNFTQDQTVLAGTRDSGMFISRDGGHTWTRSVSSGQPVSVVSLAMSSDYANDGTMFVATQGDGVFRSEDSGRRWERANFGLLELSVLAIAVSPNFTNDRIVFAATSTGMYRSRNAGLAWREVILDCQPVSIQCIAISPGFGSDRTLFTGTEEHGVFRSMDGGRSWRAANQGLNTLCINSLAMWRCLGRERLVLAATPEGVFISTDQGDTWAKDDHVPEGVLALACAPNHKVFLAGLALDGIYRCEDAGGNWAPANTGLYARPLVKLVAPTGVRSSQALFACSLADGVLRSDDGGATWASVGEDLGSPQVFDLAIASTDRGTQMLLAATGKGVSYSTDGGEKWQSLSLTRAEKQTCVLAVLPGHEGQMFVLAGVSGARLLTLSAVGDEWETVDLPLADQEILAVAFSPTFLEDSTIFVGTRGEASHEKEVTVWVSSDRGQRWERSLTLESKTGRLALAVPPTYSSDRGFLVGVDNQILRPLFLTKRATGPIRRPMWTTEKLGGPNTMITSLAVSPDYPKDQTAFAATSDGVYRTNTGGRAWKRIGDDLAKPVVALCLSPTYGEDGLVFAATLGGRIWRYQDTS